MITLTIYRSKGRWLCRSDNPRLPKFLRVSPVYPEGVDSGAEVAKVRVQECNPGRRVVLGISSAESED